MWESQVDENVLFISSIQCVTQVSVSGSGAMSISIHDVIRGHFHFSVWHKLEDIRGSQEMNKITLYSDSYDVQFITQVSVSGAGSIFICH